MSRDEVAVVTGASRGIGRGIARKFAREGYNVVLFGRDIAALKNVKEEVKSFGVNADSFSGDASNADFVNDSVDKVINHYGKVDHLVNNAGMAIKKKVIDSSLEDFMKQIDVNLYGLFNFTKAVLPSMIERRNGSIINIISLAGKNPLSPGALYSASKHAALGFTKSLLLEVREYNIRVAAICPGSVDTTFSISSNDVLNEKKLQPEDVAETVLAVIKLPARALLSEVDLRPTNPK
jgi:3-oxoacyl-[acyl-carrier protein] reductase